MGTDLKGALLKAGVVTEAQIQQAEKQKELEKKLAQKKAEHGGKSSVGDVLNRKGQPFSFMLWGRAGKLPENLDSTCCFCGERGISPDDALAELRTRLAAKGIDEAAANAMPRADLDTEVAVIILNMIDEGKNPLGAAPTAEISLTVLAILGGKAASIFFGNLSKLAVCFPCAAGDVVKHKEKKDGRRKGKAARN